MRKNFAFQDKGFEIVNSGDDVISNLIGDSTQIICSICTGCFITGGITLAGVFAIAVAAGPG